MEALGRRRHIANVARAPSTCEGRRVEVRRHGHGVGIRISRRLLPRRMPIWADGGVAKVGEAQRSVGRQE